MTSRKIERGYILSLNGIPMVSGHYAALGRMLFALTASDKIIRLWEFDCGS